MANRATLPLAFALIIVAVGGSAWPDGGSGALKRANRLYQKGERALQRGDLEEARRAFTRSLEQARGFPSPHIGLGHVAMNEREFGNALAHYQAARDGYSEHGEALREVQAQRYTRALENIRLLRDSIQQIQTAQSQAQGQTLAELRISKLQNAITRLEAIEPPDRMTPGEPPGEIFFYIGNAEFQLGKIDRAIEAWETCRAKSPAFPLVYNNLALAYWKSGQLESARSSLAKAKELGLPVNPDFEADLMQADR